MRAGWRFWQAGVAAVLGIIGAGSGVWAETAKLESPTEIVKASETVAGDPVGRPLEMLVRPPVIDGGVVQAPAPAAVVTEPARIAPPVVAAPATPIQADRVLAEVRERLKKPAAGLQPREREDRAALAAFYEGQAAKLLWTDDTGLGARGKALRTELRAADDWGLRSRDFEVAIQAGTEPAALAESEIRLGLAALKYARHARGGRVDPLELSNYLDRKPTLIPAKDVVAQLASADAPDATLRALHPKHPQFELLRQKYLQLKTAPQAPRVAVTEPDPTPPQAEQGKAGKGAKKAKAPPAAPEPVTIKKLIANMEMWRWMPADLGNRYIFSNVPEFQFRYVKAGQVIHTERLIVGKPDTQTPIFSDNMEHVIFNPTWNVPDSIKVKELLPSLARGGNILEKQGLRATLGGKPVDPSSVDLRKVDIRQLHVFQPSGQANALGLMKFMFPNAHHVYMHDTPTKPLFNQSVRSFSHGCMRVRNPQRFAEVIFAEDKGWGPERIRAAIDSKIENNQVNLTTKIPVHVAYLTLWAQPDGTVTAFRDIYGYEDKIHLGLDGKAHLIVKKKEDLGQIRAEVVGRLADNAPNAVPNLFGWMKSIFGN